MSEPGATEQSAGTAPGPGAALLAERRRQNLSLGDISRQLKLSVRQVEALERDDFAGFQSPVFVHGFIRNYAKLLSLDPAPLIAAADRKLRPAAVPAAIESDPAPRSPAPVPAKRGPANRPIAAAVVLLVVVAAIAYLGSGRKEDSPPAAPMLPAEPQVAAAPAAPEKQPPRAESRSQEKPVVEKTQQEKLVAENPQQEKPVAEKVQPPVARNEPDEAARGEPESGTQVQITQGDATDAAPALPADDGTLMIVRMIFEQESWVEIKDRNGNTVFGQLNPAGARRSARGEPPLTIVVGNAAGVRLFQGTKSIDLAPHTRVDVARLTLE